MSTIGWDNDRDNDREGAWQTQGEHQQGPQPAHRHADEKEVAQDRCAGQKSGKELSAYLEVVASPEDMFFSCVDAAFTRRSMPFLRTGVVVETYDNDGESVQVNLRNLERDCLSASRDAWPGMVERFLQAGMWKKQVLDLLEDPVEVRERALLRLCPVSFSRQFDFDLLCRPITADLSALIVLDLPESIAGFDRARLGALGLTEEELFMHARENTQRKVLVDVYSCLQGPEVLFAVIGETHPCSATHALWPDRWVSSIEGAGALVTVPNCSVVFVLPILEPTLFAALPYLLDATDLHFRVENNPISSHLYWWRNGIFRLLPRGRLFDRQERVILDELVGVVENL